jgi:hypothetical protein
MRYLSICVVLAALAAAPDALLAKGGHPLHLFPEQAAGAISWAAAATAATTTASVTVRDRRMSETKYCDGVGVGD